MNLYPKANFNNVNEINIEFLNRNNLKALILDVDNTLIDYYRNLKIETIRWVNDLKAKGIKLYILSNTNKKDKVEDVSKKLEIPYLNFAKKPSKKGFLKIQKILNLNANEIGVVGDQIFTDVIGGNRCNMFTILVEPIDKKDIWITMLKRPLEEIIKKHYRKSLEKRLKC